jgi:hypothetical protein
MNRAFPGAPHLADFVPTMCFVKALIMAPFAKHAIHHHPKFVSGCLMKKPIFIVGIFVGIQSKTAPKGRIY